MSNEKGETHPVLGHHCDGLREFQEASTYGCIPDITERGIVAGCDDSNPVPIRFCPMCGVSLSHRTRPAEDQRR